jgi:hypothetical protein
MKHQTTTINLNLVHKTDHPKKLHTAFMSALAIAYASVLSTDDYLAG